VEHMGKGGEEKGTGKGISALVVGGIDVPARY